MAINLSISMGTLWSLKKSLCLASICAPSVLSHKQDNNNNNNNKSL